jgi:radical SAM protein with 4Fe4S-binding SPASM domain
MTVTLAELKQQLKSQFDLKLICDLGEMSNSPNALFKALDDVCQEKYQPNDRIVFYTSHAVPEQLLQHLYETTNFLDISNFFIVICSPSDNRQAILTSCEKFSQDPEPFNFYPVDIVPATHTLENCFSLPKTICAIPWTHLEIQSNGNITPCCKTKELILGNIKNTTLEEAFQTDKLKNLRNELLSGKKPSACQNCWKVEEKKLTSIRMHNIKRLKKEFLTRYLDTPQISTLDIKFNNTCNFKCRICGPVSSALFAQEEHKFRGTQLVVQDNWGESENFTNQIITHLPNIKNIDMYGGEPFLVKKFEKVLKLAVNNDHARNIRLHYNSNGSIWPEQFLPYWHHFKLVDIHFSIDAIGDQFELQRGGNWYKVEENILKLKSLGLPNLSISIMPTISIMNVYYIDQVYDWATKHGFPIFVGYVGDVGMELQYLTREAKELVIKKFQNHPWHEIQNVIKIIHELPDSNGQEFQSKIKWFDWIREESFSKSHSEIAKAMGYVYNKTI